MTEKINKKMTWRKGVEPDEKSVDDLTTRFGLISNILKEKPVKHKKLMCEVKGVKVWGIWYE